MITLHATRKLFAKLPLNGEGQLPVTGWTEWLYEQPALHINPLSDWHGKLVTMQHRNCMLLRHNATRFPLAFFALTKPDFAELNDCFVDVLMTAMMKCEASDTQRHEGRAGTAIALRRPESSGYDRLWRQRLAGHHTRLNQRQPFPVTKRRKAVAA